MSDPQQFEALTRCQPDGKGLRLILRIIAMYNTLLSSYTLVHSFCLGEVWVLEGGDVPSCDKEVL